MPLPQILAGPILRRVEPTLVTVWVALSEERQVQLSLWEGLVKDDGASLLFNVSQPIIKPETDLAKTIRIGDHLHIAVVAFKLSQENALLPGRLYSYNVALKESAGSPPKEDLKSLKLLRSDPIDGKPHLALAIPLVVSFGGDTENLSIEKQDSLLVAKERTIVQWFADANRAGGRYVTLTALLADDDGKPIKKRTIVFTVGSGPDARKCSGVTRADGVARCQIATSQIFGQQTVFMDFAGDAYYESATARKSVALNADR